jgi:hypothetical protein
VASLLVSPAMLGGMPVLPVTDDDERRRQQEQLLQESESYVGVYQQAQEAEVALTLSQRRLAAETREVERSTERDVREEDVVRAARKVLAGQVGARRSARFLSRLGEVATDTADLYMLREDEARAERSDALPPTSDEGEDEDW